jgi:hypothetical protein
MISIILGIALIGALSLMITNWTTMGYFAAANIPVESEEDNFTYTFQNGEEFIDSAYCEPYDKYTTYNFWQCNLFYDKKVEVRRVDSTGSMRPILGDDGYIIIRKFAGLDELHVGDIVLIKEGIYGYEVVHRIDEIIEEGVNTYYRTKGDNNVNSDKVLISPDQIEGKVVGILY